MEKKFQFSNAPKLTKILYIAVISILAVSAIVVGIFAANSRKTADPNPDDKQINEPQNPTGGKDDDKKNPDDSQGGKTPDTKDEDKKQTFIAPARGTVATSHSSTVPAFSDTLGEWRVHLGIDVATEDGADVYAASDGTVTRVYTDTRLGRCVEITHKNNIKTLYANLDTEVAVKEGDTVKQGTKIGKVGDTTVSELADEPHLHFEMKVQDVSVNPLDYLTEEAKKVSLGIRESAGA